MRVIGLGLVCVWVRIGVGVIVLGLVCMLFG